MTDTEYEEQQPQNTESDPPFSELEMQFRTTRPTWGREATAELDKNLTYFKNKKEDNDIKRLWGLLSYYTQDIRLGNLDGQEVIYCQYWLDTAGMCLSLSCKKSFMSSMRKVITVLEVSQSKRGFLRRRMGTFTREDVKGDMSKNKPLMGGRKEE